MVFGYQYTDHGFLHCSNSAPASFASKLAPTLECISLWERACSRRGQRRHHKTLRPHSPAPAPPDWCPPPAHSPASTARP
ncbi:hypothetical protein DMX02_24905 [Pseudomonas jessenii]|nr:hypothetical protein DMX02_24905 [Pseudomonas jessenii]